MDGQTDGHATDRHAHAHARACARARVGAWQARTGCSSAFSAPCSACGSSDMIPSTCTWQHAPYTPLSRPRPAALPWSDRTGLTVGTDRPTDARQPTRGLARADRPTNQASHARTDKPTDRPTDTAASHTRKSKRWGRDHPGRHHPDMMNYLLI